MTPLDISLIALAFMLGGILKGAIGVGAPFVAVPMIALLFDVPTAVAVFVIPNTVVNLVQYVQYRKHISNMRLFIIFAIVGALGAVAGSFLLVELTDNILTLGLSGVIILFVVWRLLQPQWLLGDRMALWLAWPCGFIGGMLQGAAGISAPVSVSYLSLVDMERRDFIATISFFFFAMGVLQLPTLAVIGVMNTELFVLSCVGTIPLLCGMPIGSYFGKMLTREQFGKVLLVLLSAIALRLIADALP